MAPMDAERLARERLDADRRYNDALTLFDRTVAAVTAQPAPAPDDIARLMCGLIAFLQQITAFVESKDRELAAGAALRVDALTPALDAVAEVRTQVGVLQRAIEMLRRSAAMPPSAAPGPQATVAGASPQAPAPGRQDDDYRYVGFEDAFRGSDQAIADTLRSYVPLFDGRTDVLDIGCGRGELLSAFQAAGIGARGIDTNTEMVGVARERGLDAQVVDALGYLTGLSESSLGGIIATQVIEHLEPSYLMRVIDAAARALQPGAPIVLETINPACWLAFFSSYIRDFTHVRPVHPETLQYLLRASGFTRIEIRYSAPAPEHMRMKTIDLPADVLASPDPAAKALAQVAHTVNANAVILNNLMFTHMDYACVGYRM